MDGNTGRKTGSRDFTRFDPGPDPKKRSRALLVSEQGVTPSWPGRYSGVTPLLSRALLMVKKALLILLSNALVTPWVTPCGRSWPYLRYVEVTRVTPTFCAHMRARGLAEMKKGPILGSSRSLGPTAGIETNPYGKRLPEKEEVVNEPCRG